MAVVCTNRRTMSAETSPAGEADSSNDSGANNSTECPTCGRDDFASWRGVKLHHKRSHGESLCIKESTCEQCGEVFEYNDRRDEPHTCSVECRDKWQTGENASNWKGGKITLTCETCGDSFQHYQNKDHRRFCSYRCMGVWKSHAIAGEENPQYQGGKVRYRGPNWPRQRRKARKRDQCRCQECGTTASDLGKSPPVHHRVKIRHFKDNYDAPEWWERGNRLENLITLCPEHHAKWEHLPVQPEP